MMKLSLRIPKTGPDRHAECRIEPGSLYARDLAPSRITHLPRRSAAKAGHASRVAFTLVEVLVTVALMSFIILGLLMMFSQTQRAFMSSMTQVDVLEGGRDVMDMVVQDVLNMTPSQLPNTLNFYADTNEFTQNPSSVLQLPPFDPTTPGRVNVMEKFYFLSKNNLTWSAVGYQVVTNDATGCVGALYRLSTNFSPYTATTLTGYFTNGGTYNGVYGPPMSFWNQQVFTTSNKLADGVVDFRVRVFATNGFPLTVGTPPARYPYSPAYFRLSGSPVFAPQLPATNQVTNAFAAWRLFAGSSTLTGTEPMYCAFWSNAMPAEIEIELGLLEPKVLKTYQGLGSAIAQSNYLASHAANVHLFRQRIHLENVDPKAY
jgi:hypothetical protein